MYLRSSFFCRTLCISVCDIKSSTGHEDEVYTKLKNVPNLNVYKKEDMDQTFHYKNSRRIMPIIISTIEGYRLCKNATTCKNAPEFGKNLIIEFINFFSSVCRALS